MLFFPGEKSRGGLRLLQPRAQVMRVCCVAGAFCDHAAGMAGSARQTGPGACLRGSELEPDRPRNPSTVHVKTPGWGWAAAGTHMRTCPPPAHTAACMCPHACTCVHTSTHVQTGECKHVYTGTSVCASIATYMCSHVCKRTRAHVCSHGHTDTHAHIAHTCVYQHLCLQRPTCTHTLLYLRCSMRASI